jgi:lysozyme
MIVARNGVSHAVDTVFTTQNQYDAMVVLTFNIGVPGFMTSSVLSHHLKGEPISAMLAFPLWNKTHIDGKLVEDRGLMRRRICEAALYDTP